MIKNIGVGIDIGSKTTRVVVGEFIKGEKNPRIIGVGESETKGVRHGYLVNSERALVSLRQAIDQAEQSAGIKIKRAFVALNGVTLRAEMGSGSAVISKADGEVTSLDANKVLEDCENNLHLGNRKVVHSFPFLFRLDGKEVLGRLEGMRGTKLEAKSVFVTYSVQHLEDIVDLVGEAGIRTIDVIASPIAVSNIVLSEKEKIVGVGLVSIGDQTTSLSVFENGFLISMQTFSIGSSDITNDIALGLKIPLHIAEHLKYGDEVGEFSRKKLDEIIEARLSDIFELVENHLKKIKRNGLLPAGIVFVGGGANVRGLEECSKGVLKLPSSLGTTDMFNNSKTKLRDASWLTVLGLLTWAKDAETYTDGAMGNMFKDVKNMLKSTLKQLMP